MRKKSCVRFQHAEMHHCAHSKEVVVKSAKVAKSEDSNKPMVILLLTVALNFHVKCYQKDLVEGPGKD